MFRNASRLVVAAAVFAALVGLPLTGAQAQTSENWSTYLNNGARTGYDSGEKLITPATASKLIMLWNDDVGSSISVEPIQVNGIIYYGSWDGYERAAQASTGAQIWATNLGRTSVPTCGEPPTTVGVASTAAVGAIKVHGRVTQTVFVGGGHGSFYALNASTGHVIWRTHIGSPPGYFLWSSPLFYHGSIYEGIASFGDCPLIRGGVIRMNASTGTVENRIYTVPPGCIGAGVWGSPTVDAATGDIYFATGNAARCKRHVTLSVSVIRTNASLKLIGNWRVPNPNLPNNDSDFGSTPTLFSASIKGVVHKMVGIQNKNGIYYALNRYAITRGPIWQDRMSIGGNCPQCSDGGDISPSAYDGHDLFIGSERTHFRGVICAGSIREVKPSTGQVVWTDCLGGSVLGAVTAVPGVAFFGAGNAVYAVSTSTGTILWKFQDTNGGSNFWGALTISDGRVYFGNQDGNLYAFGLPTSG